MSDRFLDILRHGEAAGGARFRGRRDDPLTAAGQGQMWSVAAGEHAWDAVISSPARRCAEFGEALAAKRGLPFEIWSELGERSFGRWDELTAVDIAPADLEAFWADPVGFTPPGGEPFLDFHGRASSAWGRLLATRWARPLVVAHGGLVRVVIGQVLELPFASLGLVEVPNGCLTRIRVPAPPGRPSLVFHRGPP